MKWIKHYTDASNDEGINSLEQKFGPTGYAVYWKTLEFCGQKWDGKTEPKFSFNRRRVKSILNLRYTKIESVYSSCTDLTLFFVTITPLNYDFYIPKLLNIKDNHARNLQVADKLVSANLLLEQNRTDKNRRERDQIVALAGINSPDDLLQYWNDVFQANGYPACPLTLGGTNQQNFFLINKRLIENKSTWMDYLNRVDSSVFLTKKKKGGKPSLTWLLSEVNFDDVWAGKYDKDDSSGQIDGILNDLKLEA